MGCNRDLNRCDASAERRPALSAAKRARVFALLGGASLVCASLGLAPSAAAQIAPPAQAPTANASANPTGDARAAEASSQLSEVIVTATRQSQNINRVPISVSAFTQEKMDLQGIKSFADVARYTPGVTFDPSTKDVSIRGVSSTAGAATTGVYIDDTPIQVHVIGFNSNNTLPAIFDLERVEVLRGPQGTLFGAGSEGGTVRYITPQPSLTKYSAYARAEGSTTDGGAGSGEFGVAVGGPIVEDKLGFRVSAWYRRDGGYVDRVDQADDALTRQNSNGQDTVALRAALTWAPISSLTITPSIYYQKRNQHDTDEYWVGLSDPSRGVYQNGDPEERGDVDKYALPALRIQYSGPGFDVISNTSYFYRHEVAGYEGTLYNLSYFQQLISDPTGQSCGACTTGGLYPLLTPKGFNLPGFGSYSSPNTVTNKQNDLNQEIRIQSTNPDSRISWVVGVFYERNRQLSVEEIHDPQLEQITQYLFGESAEDYWGEGLLPQYGDDDYINYDLTHDEQIAGFADVTLALTKQLKLEGGLRYARTHFDYNFFVDGAQNCSGPNDCRNTGAGSETEYPLTPKGSLQFQADRNNLFYATYAKGYREGGGSPQVNAVACASDLSALNLTNSPAAYHSDTVDSYEIGSKNQLLEHRLQFEGSLYYLRWHNIQQEILLPSCGYQYTGNLGEAEGHGFDVQLQYQVIHNLVTELSVGYTQIKYIQNAYAVPATSTGLLATDGDAIGTPYAASPWTVAFGAQYNFKLGAHSAFARVDYEFTSHNNDLTSALDPQAQSYDPALRNPPATNFVSLRSGVDLEGVNLSVFCDNLLDAHPQLALTHQDQFTLLLENSTFRPRTVGLTATYRY